VRAKHGDVQLLVFDHVDVDAGVQIPAGTVELNEDILVAAKRELMEEAGIRATAFARIAVIERNWSGIPVQAHLLAAWALADTADEWIHSVTGSGEDEGLRFRLYWLARSEWHKLYGDFKIGYPALHQFIAESTNTINP